MVDAFVGERKQTYDVEEGKAEELGASLSRALVLTDSSRNKCVSECDRAGAEGVRKFIPYERLQSSVIDPT